MGIVDPECVTCDGGRAATAVSPRRGWDLARSPLPKAWAIQISSTCSSHGKSVCLGGPESPFCLSLRLRSAGAIPWSFPTGRSPRKGLAVDGRAAEKRVLGGK
ncbi:hypothetical protein PgNI_06151 [Pyricularia grisea]|uniref:Uncharacterized protein n=1 Tax=Pyricularia grisea TaxID=148305 RepID=A0A6P8B856_PYRGI|nr:hypothetical protein PgNI_06151 [Pyricularia grisea]TLD11294.1 hypothetical protein PgNI_06151 [Pyricularia grisea]